MMSKFKLSVAVITFVLATLQGTVLLKAAADAQTNHQVSCPITFGSMCMDDVAGVLHHLAMVNNLFLGSTPVGILVLMLGVSVLFAVVLNRVQKFSSTEASGILNWARGKPERLWLALRKFIRWLALCNKRDFLPSF